MSGRKVWKKLLIFISDLLISSLLVGGIWVGNYLLPQEGIQARAMPSAAVPRDAGGASGLAAEGGESDISSFATQSGLPGSFPPGTVRQEEGTADTAIQPLQATKVLRDTQDWHQKFADQFTGQVVETDTSYTSPNLAIHLSWHTLDSGKLDHTSQGQHEKYGTQISYVLADIYVGDIICLQTGFAQDTYGVGFSEKLSDMSARLGAVLAVNGDSYSNSRHQDNGTIIRNGIIYRAQPTDMETCVLNWDGTMKIYGPEEMNTQQLIDSGAYQSWIFGPSLLDENGKAKSTFLTWNYIRQSHPRTAIGYYEPGHYCLLVVDGRQESSRGMFLDEMSAVFEQLGCSAAYNLDGATVPS